MNKTIKIIMSLIAVLVVGPVYAEKNENSKWRDFTSTKKKYYMSLGVGRTESDASRGVGFRTDKLPGKADIKDQINLLMSYGFKVNQIRVEGELIWVSADVALKMVDDTEYKGSLGSVDLTLGVFYDIETDTYWTPYVGGRFGVKKISFERKGGTRPNLNNPNQRHLFYDKRGQDIVLTYSLETGVRYTIPAQFQRNITFDLGYRYTQVGSSKFKETILGRYSNTTFRTHNLGGHSSESVQFKVQYDFN